MQGARWAAAAAASGRVGWGERRAAPAVAAAVARALRAACLPHAQPRMASVASNAPLAGRHGSRCRRQRRRRAGAERRQPQLWKPWRAAWWAEESKNYCSAALEIDDEQNTEGRHLGRLPEAPAFLCRPGQVAAAAQRSEQKQERAALDVML